MRFLARAAAAAVFSSCATFALAHDQLGANLNFIADFFRNHEFNDLVKQSRAFLKAGPGNFNDANPAERASVGPDGWPTEDFKLFAMTSQTGVTGLGGTYKLVFTGTATLAANGATILNQVYTAGTDTTRADVVFAEGTDTLFIDFTDTAGSVKNVRLLRPGVAEGSPQAFTPTWLAHANRFTVLRFLDWTRTNGNRHVAWADRTTPEKLRTETLIAQWETVIAAANALNRDAWINVPVLANDAYVTNLATLLRDTLNSNLNVYVEYGNELWNFSIRDVGLDDFNGGTPFNGATENRNLAAASPPGSPLRFVGPFDGPVIDDTTLAFRRVALRLKEISDIFKTVWGAPAINTRVRPVLAGQMANSFAVSEGLRMIDEGLGVKPDTVFYAIAGAPYIFPAAIPNGDSDENPTTLTATDILNGLAAGVANAPSETNAYQYLSHAGMGAWYGLKVMAYEAGFDNFGGNNLAAKRDANLAPAIKQICKDYLNQWHSFGFEHILWFNAGAGSYNTPFGMWPLLEDMGAPAQPKNQCMDEILAAPKPAMTTGTPIAAPVAGGNFRGSAAPAGALTGGAGVMGFPGYAEYLVRADVAGPYDLVFTGSAPPGEFFTVRLNNTLVSTNVTLPAAEGAAPTLTVTLRAGLNAIRISRTTGGGASWSITNFSLAFTGTPTPILALDPTSYAFAGQSMGTTSFAQNFSVTNTGTAALNISSISLDNPQFAYFHDCATVAPGASCGGVVYFQPAASPGPLNASATITGTLAFTSNAPGSPHALSLSGLAERSLVSHYYRAILGRAPDAPGKSFWEGEAARLSALGVNVNETWFVMAGYFFNSPEYATFNRSNADFVADLYATFFNRAPDAGGLNYWVGQIEGGLPREVVLFSFMFSNEFRTFAQGLFGNTASRPEVDLVVDLFRGILNRLPDTASFNYWLGRIREAQCAGAGPVFTEIDAMSAAFFFNPEYNNRGRNNTQIVTDMYYSFLRRGGDIGGVQYWINELNTGARTLNDVRINFINNPEFGGRVQEVIAAGCAP